MTQKNSISLRVELEDRSTKEFEAIKDHFGMKNSSEVIRKIIREKYLDLFEKEASG